MGFFTYCSEIDPYFSTLKHYGLTTTPINDDDPTALKAYSCSLMVCQDQDNLSPVCACNFNTGNVVSFKNQCDVLKHNCRFDTGFRVILNEICPWEFQSRRDNSQMEFDYNDPKYYND
ncbi:unnamed protein product [Colias eurytheme]|nr:unnamed protein product [Colias eurytheme]